MWTFLIPIAVFGAIAVVAWLLMDFITGRDKQRTEQRLDELRDPRLRDAETTGSKQKLAKALEAATPALSKPLQPQNAKDAADLRRKLAHAGFRSENAQGIYLTMKTVCIGGGVFLSGGSVLLTGAYDQMSLLKAAFVAIGAFFLPNIVLWYLTKRRQEGIFLGLPDALDLMVVCVEAGLGLDSAMRKVAEEMKKSYPVIAEEFGICNLHLQMGRTRSEVLKDLGDRNGVDDLSSLASILIQADKFGSSIAQALRVQSDSMRVRRRQIAEEKAAKTAVKLIFPLVMFIFPGIFVVLVGPAAITMVREMFPAMSGG